MNGCLDVGPAPRFAVCHLSEGHAGRHSWETEEQFLDRVAPDLATVTEAEEPKALGRQEYEPKECVRFECASWSAIGRTKPHVACAGNDCRCTCGQPYSAHQRPASEPLVGENTCEHGDHPAPAGKRFCSDACARCERYSDSENGCDGICRRSPDEPAKQPVDLGAHYRARGGVEPIDFITSNGLSFCEGNVVKYVARWRAKNGIEDLRKARWYIDRLIAQAEGEGQ